jgi:membrane protease YdiL (CAAX protease family)
MTGDEGEDHRDAAEAPPVSAGRAWLIAAGVTIASASALALGLARDDRSERSLAVCVGGAYAVLAALAIARLRRRGELGDALRPRSGDVSTGAFVAALLYGAAMGAAKIVTPHGTPREAWIASIYAMLGDPAAPAYHVTSALFFGIAALEEIAWRGLVMRALDDAFGPGRAWIVSTLLYALAHLPAAFLLKSMAGLNPLLALGALGGGLVWGHLVNRTGRLVPSIFAHALFTWAVVEFPLWRL